MKNYEKLYQLQDKVLGKLDGLFGKLYITGGTALGRYYLHHRFSDDIDLFTNNDDSFKPTINKIRVKLGNQFKTDPDGLIVHDDFMRIWVIENDQSLKIEMVNDVAGRYGKTLRYNSLPIDNPGNILANKLTAVVGRDEPKDVFDIICLSKKYSFNWGDIFNYSVQKAMVAEQDVAIRLSQFQVETIKEQAWKNTEIDVAELEDKLTTISNDFLFARENSLGADKMHISEATISVK